jgi:hypothetical protein
MGVSITRADRSWYAVNIECTAEVHDLECRNDSLETENARLRAALQDIASMSMHSAMYVAGDVAREALGRAA